MCLHSNMQEEDTLKQLIPSVICGHYSQLVDCCVTQAQIVYVTLNTITMQYYFFSGSGRFTFVSPLNISVRSIKVNAQCIHTTYQSMTTYWFKTTLNYQMMMERYPNLKEEVGSSTPGCEISARLDRKTCQVVSCLLCFDASLSTFYLKSKINH